MARPWRRRFIESTLRDHRRRGGATKKTYHLPGGDAVVTLKQFADNSGEQIVYLIDNVRGEKTNPVTGEFAARDALERMLAGTALVATQDPTTGALVVGRRRHPAPNAKSPSSEPEGARLEPSPGCKS